MEDPKVGKVAVDKVDKIEGEARVNNRKAKLIFFYEWEIKFTWKGCVNGKDKEGKPITVKQVRVHEQQFSKPHEISVAEKQRAGANPSIEDFQGGAN